MSITTYMILLSTVVICAIRRFYPVYAMAAWAFPASVVALYFIYRVFIYPFYLSPFRHLPEPTGAKFPWGHAEFIRKESNGEPFRRWINAVPNKGIIRFRVFLNQERLFLTSPDAMREVLITRSYDFTKPSQPGFLFRELLGNGILVAEGDDHKQQRKGLSPAFSFRHIKDLYPTFWSKGKQSTEEIAARVKDVTTGQIIPPSQSAYDWASRTTLDIIGLAAIGHDFNAIGNPDGEIVATYKTLFENEPPQFFWTSIGIWTPLELLFQLPLQVFKDAKAASNTIRRIGYDMLKKKRASMKKDANTDIDILSVAMTSGVFDDDDLVNQLMTFLAAGHETTASALTWATYILCKHPDVQSRLREEIQHGLPSIRAPESTITALQMDRLPYLNAVCNEVLRIMSSVPMTLRDSVASTSILGIPIASGTRLIIAPWAVNASHELWGDNALSFDPERWLGEGRANSGGANSNFANLTFLHGPRSCIGKDFAKAEFKCLLAAWTGRFEISFENGELETDIMGWITVRPRHGLPVVFREVGKW